MGAIWLFTCGSTRRHSARHSRLSKSHSASAPRHLQMHIKRVRPRNAYIGVTPKYTLEWFVCLRSPCTCKAASCICSMMAWCLSSDFDHFATRSAVITLSSIDVVGLQVQGKASIHCTAGHALLCALGLDSSMRNCLSHSCLRSMYCCRYMPQGALIPERDKLAALTHPTGLQLVTSQLWT